MSQRVLIHFCRTCGFGPLAEQIAEAIRREFGSALGLTVECQASYWGCFRVELDGTEIFNRWKTRGWLGRLGFGREPSAEEIISQIRHRYNLVSDGTVGFPWPGEAATKTFDGDDQLDKGADLFEPQTMRRS